MVAAMKTSPPSQNVHPVGEAPRLPSGPLPVDTYGGRIHVEWNPQAAVTPLGQLPFFIEFLKTSELFAPWVQGCPLTYQSPTMRHRRSMSSGRSSCQFCRGTVGMPTSRRFGPMASILLCWV